MRQGIVYNNKDVAGTIVETNKGEYIFTYSDNYFFDATKPAISLTLPKKQKEHHSKTLFSFFFNLLSEGYNKMEQCRIHKIDENDHFGLLLKTANEETIGAIRVVRLA
jgi:serine/threonine-protein kinase HipA